MIRPATADDFENVLKVGELRFGTGYLTREEFNTWLEYPEFLLVAEMDGRFAGYVYHRPEKIEVLAKYMKLDPDYVRRVSGGKPVIHCRSAALSPEFEHCGIMFTMVEALEKKAREEGFGAEFAPAWKYGDKVPMRKILTAMGYTELCEKERLWYDQEDYYCVVCKGRCVCTAVIFQKIL